LATATLLDLLSDLHTLVALDFAEKASSLRVKKLSYHIYRFLLSQTAFLDFIAEDVQKLSRHFVGALKLWETNQVSPKYIIIELTYTIQVWAPIFRTMLPNGGR
jgi:hypothetical protein